jgi:ribonuclease P protein component
VHALARAEGRGPTRVALAVKVRPRSAVARNRARRRLRAAFRACSVPDGYDVVVRGDEDVLTADFQELTEALGAALRSAGVGPS